MSPGPLDSRALRGVEILFLNSLRRKQPAGAKKRTVWFESGPKHVCCQVRGGDPRPGPCGASCGALLRRGCAAGTGDKPRPSVLPSARPSEE